MTDETPQTARIRQIIEALFERPIEERASFLDQECGDDAELRVSVEKVLHAAEGRLDEAGVDEGTTLGAEIDDLIRDIELKDWRLSRSGRKVGIEWPVWLSNSR